MESFTIDLVSNASAQLFPNNTLRSFTNFLPEQLNLEGQWEVAISEISYPSMYRNATEGKFMFFDKNLQRRFSFIIWNPVSAPPLRIFLKPWTLSFKRHNHSKSCIKVKVSQWTQQVEIYLGNEGSGLAFSSRTWDTILVAMLAMNLEWCWEKRDLTSQNLITTLSAYTLSWYRLTSLSKTSLVTRRPHCCTVFVEFTAPSWTH